MADVTVPLVTLDPDGAGKAPIISYNVPDPVSYPVTHLMELRVPDGLLKALPPPERPAGVVPSRELVKALGQGVVRDDVFPLAFTRKTSLALLDTDFAGQVGGQNVAAGGPGAAVASTDLIRMGAAAPVTRALTKLPVAAVAEELERGKRFSIRRNLYGTHVAELLPPVQPGRKPALMIVERYRLSSFLGQYGAGRTLNTFTLLLGERTKITVKSFTRTESETQRASSILHSFSETSASESEDSLETEQSDRSKHDDSLAFEASMEGQYGVSFATHVSVKAGVKTSSANSREQFGKSVQNATSKHAQGASAKRDVKIDTSNKQTNEKTNEQVIEREIANINVGRTLNFVFRQMLQEFITVTRLVDVRVAYWDGHVENKREMPLHQLDELLEEVAEPGEAAAELRRLVLAAVDRVVDHEGKTRTFVEEHRPFEDEPPYLRVVPRLTSKYADTTGNEFTVPGIITRAQKLTMRTEGVVVEAVLGQGNALDPYSKALQEEAVRNKALENAAREDEAARAALARTVVGTGTAVQAESFQKVFYAPPMVDDDD